MYRAIGSRLAVAFAVALTAGACSQETAQSEAKEGGNEMGVAQTSMGGDVVGAVEYTLVLKSSWTKDNHPVEYPEAHAISGPHFSGLIGASHNASYTLFAEGATPTPGLERLSEEGKHTPLDAEIRAAIAAGSASTLFSTGGLRDFTDSLVTTVRVDPQHPFVSLVAMIAPSPDWFAGVSNVNLMENGQWAASRTLELRAYDSGGDDGTTYKAADKDTNPKKPTMPAMTPHFVVNGKAVPVATVTLTRK